jgi:hypothetical protein
MAKDGNDGNGAHARGNDMPESAALMSKDKALADAAAARRLTLRELREPSPEKYAAYLRQADRRCCARSREARDNGAPELTEAVRDVLATPPSSSLCPEDLARRRSSNVSQCQTALKIDPDRLRTMTPAWWWIKLPCWR